jgi:hypothetical protein
LLLLISNARIVVLLVFAACHGTTEPPQPDGGPNAGPDAAPTVFADPPLNGPPFVVNPTDCGCQRLASGETCNMQASPNTIAVQAVDLDTGGAVQIDTIACRGLVYSDKGSRTRLITRSLHDARSLSTGELSRRGSAASMIVFSAAAAGGPAPRRDHAEPVWLPAKATPVLRSATGSACMYPRAAARSKRSGRVTFPRTCRMSRRPCNGSGSLPAIVDPDRIGVFSAGAHRDARRFVGDVAAVEGRAGRGLESSAGRRRTIAGARPQLLRTPSSPDHIGPNHPQTDPVYNNDPLTPDHKCPEDDDWRTRAWRSKPWS